MMTGPHIGYNASVRTGLAGSGVVWYWRRGEEEHAWLP
jgi:hypothetical protein